MDGPPLRSSTGNESADALLQRVVKDFENGFQGRIGSYWLVGSYAEGKALPTSDIDIGVIFKGEFESGEEGRARDLSRALSGIGDVRVDIALMSEAGLHSKGARYVPTLKLGGLLIFGEDIRDRVSMPPMDVYARGVAEVALRFFARIRNLELAIYPLAYPDPEGQFFGYEEVRIPELYPPGVDVGTRELVVTLGRAAAAVVAARGAGYVPTRDECLRLYHDCVGDPWASFLYEVHEKCRERWAYRVPDNEADRRILHELCRRALYFENHAFLILLDAFPMGLTSSSPEGRPLFDTAD